MSRGIYRPRGADGRPLRIWHIRYVDDQGHYRRESAGTESKVEAQALLDRRRGQRQTGELPPRASARVLFRDVVPRYLDAIEGLRCRPQRKRMLERWLPRWGDLPLAAFTPAMVERHLADRSRGGAGPATLNRDLQVIRHVLSRAVAWRLLDRAVLERLSVVRYRREPVRLRYLTMPEVTRLLDACDPWFRTAVEFALNTGLRKSEQFGLTWDRVDLVGRTATIPAEESKSRRGRVVPLNDAAVAALKAIPRKLNGGLVWSHPDGSRLRWYARKRFAAALRKAKIPPGFHWHDLRATCASWLVMSGADLLSVAEILGHSLAMVQRYAHLSSDHKASLIGRLYASSTPVAHHATEEQRRERQERRR